MEPERVDDAFRTIRHNRGTKLENQKLALKLLDAAEMTLKEGGLANTPENYFLALWPLLDEEGRERKLALGKTQASAYNTAVIYLASFVAPRLCTSFCQQHYSMIYAKLKSGLARFPEEAPFIRAAIVCIQGILVALKEEWEERSSLRELYMLLLGLSLDRRPKVRKAAQEAIVRMMEGTERGDDQSNDQRSTKTQPVVDGLLSFVLRALERSTRKEFTNALHLIPMLSALAPHLDGSSLQMTIPALLKCLSLENTHLTAVIYGLIGRICKVSGKERTDDVMGMFPLISSALLKEAPSITNTILIPPWLKAITCLSLAQGWVDKETLRILFGFFACSDEEVLRVVEESLSMLYGLIKTEGMGVHLAEHFGRWLQAKGGERCIPHLIRSVADFARESDANLVLLPRMMGQILEQLALRHDTTLRQHAELIERTLGEFVARCGPELFLKVVPLGMDGTEANGSGKERPRAWLLPVLKERISHAPLAFFHHHLVPLAKAIESKCDGLQKAGKTADCKIYQLAIHQIWSTLPSFLTHPTDLPIAFPPLAPLLGALLNENVQLRPVIANALCTLIRCCADKKNDHSKTDQSSASDLQVIRSFVPQFMPLLFNIYGATAADQRDCIARCIEVFVSIASPEMIAQYFARVVERLEGVIKGEQERMMMMMRTEEEKKPKLGQSGQKEELVALLELSFILTTALDLPARSKLMAVVIPILTLQDVLMQKRAYRVLGDLLRGEQAASLLEEHLDTLEKQLLTDGGMQTAIIKGRLRLLLAIAPLLPDDRLHWVPLFLPEAVLGTKEVNAKSRLAAFDLVLAWARRMSRGGRVEGARTAGLLENTIEASLHEYMMMVIAGLAGVTSYMISATITALARLLYEFRESIDGGEEEAKSESNRQLLKALLHDIITLLHSPNREVVKSALGFVKVAIITLRLSLLKPHLKEMIGGVLEWAHEHTQHFKLRVRHLMERLIRRFGFDRIWSLTPPAHHPLLSNIRKQRQRQEKKRQMERAGKEMTHGDDDENYLDSNHLTEAALAHSSMLQKKNTKSTLARGQSGDQDGDTDMDGEGDDDAFDNVFDGVEMLGEEEACMPDQELEKVLDRKLSLSTNLARQQKQKARLERKDEQAERAKRRRVTTSMEDDEVHLDDAGLLHIADQSSDLSESEDGHDKVKPFKKRERHHQRAPPSSSHPSQPILKRNNKGKRPTKSSPSGDAKLKSEKYEPYSYLPIQRSRKGSKPAIKGRHGKNASRYFLKRA